MDGIGPSSSMPCSAAIASTGSMPTSPEAANSAAACKKPSIGAPGAWTTKATASLADSLRTVCGVPPASGTVSPVFAVPTERGREVIALAQGMVPELESAVAHELSDERLVTLREDFETIRQAALTYKNSLRASSVG